MVLQLFSTLLVLQPLLTPSKPTVTVWMVHSPRMQLMLVLKLEVPSSLHWKVLVLRSRRDWRADKATKL